MTPLNNLQPARQQQGDVYHVKRHGQRRVRRASSVIHHDLV